MLTSNEGSKYEGIRFRIAILNTISLIGKFLASILPSQRVSDQYVPVKCCLTSRHPHYGSHLAHVPLARHLRHILPLLTLSGTSATRYMYTADTDMHVAAISSTDDDVSGRGKYGWSGGLFLVLYCCVRVSEPLRAEDIGGGVGRRAGSGWGVEGIVSIFLFCYYLRM